ncbi:AlbA family DNA-binding domain-containing protein [Shewanella litorisediminis]|uniref:ATP-binding protein n=1 Tax=Shewanella litorisediminis TaxID=1173586 RepID=A0ABX7G2H4_9GAMM|nr:ATP-binding protein [Shewanella litorisediminis]MCL2918634.1 ATP-binding protein [Shewanella litorisediminis]QRH01458.1 ATP-binding protein [Shewanella litorisediminis]
MTQFALDDIQHLRESVQVEFKLAAGRDGKGQLPEGMWESYSAFANTLGGEIILGVRESQGEFTIEGIANPLPMLEDIWRILKDPRRVSCNVLSPTDVQIIELAGKKLIRLHVPEAAAHQKPVFLGPDPYTGTFFRVDSSDMRASRRQVSQLLKKQRRLCPPEQ